VAKSHGVAQVGPGDACETLLWRLDDEAAAELIATPPALDTRLQVFIVGGAFSDCFGNASIAYRDGIAAMTAAGMEVVEVPISGRSSAEYNARAIADAIANSPTGPVVLLGYSKGTVDILVFLADYPELAGRVRGVISVAGPVYGSQLAERGDWAYDLFLQRAFSGRCDPGDGGVLHSLLPEARQQWLATHPLPDHVRYYSLLAFTTSEHIARVLGPSWQILAATDPRNDGQITIAEGVLPGSTLLGYANTDHWGVAIDIEEELSFLAGRDDESVYPRSTMFEALVRYVSEDLREPGAMAGGLAPEQPPRIKTAAEMPEGAQ
jgi:pimeloyl-ACP methyl ester carboxylesterase